MNDKCEQLMTISGGFHFWLGKVLAEIMVGGILLVAVIIIAAWITWPRRSKT